MYIKKNNLEKTQDEIIIESKIKSGEEIEITKALDILAMLKDNMPLESISKNTKVSISKIEEIKTIFKNQF